MAKKLLRSFALMLIVCMVMSSFMITRAEEVPNAKPPIATIESGDLRGFVEDGIYTFLGIPYATAGRFEQPQKVEPWEGVRDAQAYGPICPIVNTTTVSANAFPWPRRYWVQNEDCMNLNVWTPSLDKDAKKPVMVFFHGGGMTNGSSIEGVDYDGKNLSEYGDVVVVTVNHRLNVLGCLDLSAYGEEYKNSGNIVMADLVASLQWVHDNIEVFGGDPSRVLIFGQSGGSSKTANMYYIPAADGLYSCGIGLSAGSPSTTPKGESAKVAARMLEILGLTAEEVDVLKTLPYEELIAVGNQAMEDVGARSWGPMVDNEYMFDEMTDYGKTCPYICGSVFSEWSGTVHKGIKDKNFWSDEKVDEELTNAYGDQKDAVVDEFLKLFPNKKIQDVMFYHNRNTDAVQKAYDQSNSNVYHYLFSFEAPVNGGITAFHGGELHYFFHNVGMRDITIATGGTPECYKMQDIIVNAMLNLVKTGDPSQEGLEWKPWTPDGLETMIFDEDARCVSFDDTALDNLIFAE